MTKTYYYARVSSADQNLCRQLDAFRQLGADDRNIVTDKQSGKDLDRAGYQTLKTSLLREGDTLVIKSLDRLSRNKADIKSELQWMTNNNIRLKVIDIPTTMADLPAGQEWIQSMINNILIEVLSSMAEQERLTIRKRQAEGIASAKARGQHLGRPTAQLPDNWDDVIADWKAGKITAVKAMELTGMKKATFYKYAM